MALPVNIEKLIHGEAVEWERLEFKKNWNPEDVIHSICAFANDINNWGGGYIIIGIEAVDGRPVLPPAGLPANSIDKIQLEIVELCYKIQPNYRPSIQPVFFMGNHIIIIWVTSGDMRPYSAPSTLGKKAERKKYIRFGSTTIIAKGPNDRQLDELTARVPFDDRINQNASIDDLDLGLIQAYLKLIKSGLYEESKSIPFTDLCRKMFLAKGPDEFLRPVNVGLMFFNETPNKFFNRAYIDIVIHKDDSGKEFIEERFSGPLNKQLKDAIDFIKLNVIRHEIRKVDSRPEAPRLTNYPETAVEESLANAVYHKGYDMASPIEIQIFIDKINILSYPGPLPPIDRKALKQRTVVARDYRNRRIGDFLKDMELTEGRATGFPAIYSSMENNGSPLPEFDTDDLHTYFLTTLKIHPAFLKLKMPNGIKVPITLKDINALIDWLITNHARDIAGDIADALYGTDYHYNDIHIDGIRDIARDIVRDIADSLIKSPLNILEFCLEFKSREAILNYLGLVKNTKNYNSYMAPLVELGWLAMLNPISRTSPKQLYRTTLKGALILKFLKAAKI